MFWVTFVLFFPNQRHPKAQGTFITVLGYPLEELSVPSWLLPEGMQPLELRVLLGWHKDTQ